MAVTPRKNPKRDLGINDVLEAAIESQEHSIQMRELHRVRQKNIGLTAEIKRLQKEVEQWEQRVEFVEQISGDVISHRWEEKKISKKTPVAPIIILSDWHVGENVDPATVNGLNEYDPKIARIRAERTFCKIGDYIERFTPMAEVCYIHLGGDFVTGYIHDELVESNHLSPVEEVLLAKELIVNGLEYLRRRKVVKKIICPTSVGNHGRTTPKKRVSTSCKNSFEWMMYSDISRSYQRDKFVDFVVCEGYQTLVEIFGRKVSFSHGDAIQYQGGIGGPTIPIIKAIAGWQKSPTAAELYCMGHLHQFINGGNFVVNSSMIGYGPFSLWVKAGFEPPSQTFIGFSKSRGIYMTAKMFCEE